MRLIRKVLVAIWVTLFCAVGYAQDSYTMSATVEFVVNTDRIIQNRNYTHFVKTVVPFISDNANDIERVLLIGSASPEGSSKRNIYLANIRAEKIYSYFANSISKYSIDVVNNYELFLKKTGLDESDYSKLRATYVEIVFKKDKPKVEPEVKPVPSKIDTVYIDSIRVEERVDTVYVPRKDTDSPVFGVYNSLNEDLLQRPNIGIEFYFHQMSWFLDGSFSSGTLFGKNYDIDFWHTGLRKYFNSGYDELYLEFYGRAGWYDTDLFKSDGNGVFGVFFGCGLGIGYKFSVCKHWTITPSIRFGFDNFKFNDYYFTNGNGGIEVSFGKYTDGRNPTTEVPDNQIVDKNGNTVYLNDRTLSRDFFNNACSMYWFGPTYIGLTIQRNFYIHKIVKTNGKNN